MVAAPGVGVTDTIHVIGEGGVVFEMDLPLPEGVAQRLERGDLRRVNADGTPYECPVEPVEPAEEDPFAVKRPADGAGKQDWVTYAVSKGATVNEANGFTKLELIELYGGQ